VSERPARILLLYTGGTIGMDGQPLAPMSVGRFAARLDQLPGFGDSLLRLRSLNGEIQEVHYTLDALAEPIDSSSMAPQDWVAVARRILSRYEEFDGFVVVHGTDTMAWTASALAFLLEGLARPIVVTGSQLPLSHPRSDGPRNLVTAMELAATTSIPEVGLFFDMSLYRGCRASKVSTSTFGGFASPNYPPLATAGIAIDVREALVRLPPPAEASLESEAHRRRVAARLDAIERALPEFSVLSMVLFPGIQASNAIDVLLRSTEPPVLGLVLQAFGEGNAPATPRFLHALQQAHERGVVIVDGTQVVQGEVNVDAYASARGLEHAGAISGFDMTPQAAQAKLIYLLALGLTQANVETLMQRNMRGELRAVPGVAQGLVFEDA